MGPSWCGSVDGALAYKPRGHRFKSPSRHMPELWARSPVGGSQEATYTDTSLSLFLPPFPSV